MSLENTIVNLAQNFVGESLRLDEENINPSCIKVQWLLFYFFFGGGPPPNHVPPYDLGWFTLRVAAEKCVKAWSAYLNATYDVCYSLVWREWLGATKIRQAHLRLFIYPTLGLHPRNLTFWTQVDERWFSFSDGWFSGSMLAFRGVCWFICGSTHYMDCLGRCWFWSSSTSAGCQHSHDVTIISNCSKLECGFHKYIYAYVCNRLACGLIGL